MDFGKRSALVIALALQMTALSDMYQHRPR